jgi:hypothetical protein
VRARDLRRGNQRLQGPSRAAGVHQAMRAAVAAVDTIDETAEVAVGYPESGDAHRASVANRSVSRAAPHDASI